MADLAVEGSKPKQKKESYFSFGDDQAPVTLPYIPSWLQQTQVMYSKLPMLHAPSGTITLFTTGLCEKLHFTPSDLEFDCSANEFFLEYKSLHDPHLKNLYHQARTVRRLIKQGFITPELKVKCSLEEFNIYHQYLKKMKLNRMTQKQKRQMDKGREERLNQAMRKKEQPSERDRRGAAARERKAAKVKEEHKRLISHLERDALKRAKLLKERCLQRGIVGAQKSLQMERRRIAHIALDLQERQRKALIIQKRTEKEEACAKLLSEQKERKKAERERKLATHWGKQERLRRQQMSEQAVKDGRKRMEMQQKIEARKRLGTARQKRNQAEFLKIRDERAKHCQEREQRIEKALAAKMKKVCTKYEKKSAFHRPGVSMSFPPIDKGFKGHVARGSEWSSVESSLQTTSLDPADGVWNYPTTKQHKVSSPSASTISQLSTSSTVLPPILVTSDFSVVGDEYTESTSVEVYPESIHHRTELSDTTTEDSLAESDAIAEDSITVSEAATEASSIVEESVTFPKASQIEVDTLTEDSIAVTEDGIAVGEDTVIAVEDSAVITGTVPQDTKVVSETVAQAIPGTESQMHAFAKVYVKQDVLGGLAGPVSPADYDTVVHNLLNDVYSEIAEENPEMVDEDGDVPATDDLYLDLIAKYEEMHIHATEDTGSHGNYPSGGDSSRSIIDVPYPVQIDEEGESLPLTINQMAEEVVRRVILSVFLYLKTTGELLPNSSVSSLQAEGTSGTRRSSASSSGPTFEETSLGSIGEKVANMESISQLLEQLPSSAAELCRSSQERSPKFLEEADRHSSLVLMESMVDASSIPKGEVENEEEELDGGEDEEVIGIVENEVISEEQSHKSLGSYGDLAEVFREREDGSLMIEGAIAEKVLDSPERSLTEAALSIESLHRYKSGEQTSSSSSCHLNKSATDEDVDGVGSGEATRMQYHSVIPVYQTTLLHVSDDLITRNLSLISSKPEGNRLAAAHQASGRNSFRNVFRPDITYCAQSLQSLQSLKKSVEKNQGELGFLEEEKELSKKDSKEQVITVEETEGVCYLPTKKTYQVTYDTLSASVRSLNQEQVNEEDSSPSAEEREDGETKKKRRRKSKKRRSDKKDVSDKSGSETGSTEGSSVSAHSDSPQSRGSMVSPIQTQGSDTKQLTEGEEIEKKSYEVAEVTPQEKSGSVASVLDSIVSKISQLFGGKKDGSLQSLKHIPSTTTQSAEHVCESDYKSKSKLSDKMMCDGDVTLEDWSAKLSSDEQYEAEYDTKGKDQMTKDTMTDKVSIKDPEKREEDSGDATQERQDEETPSEKRTEEEVGIPNLPIAEVIESSLDEPSVEVKAEESINIEEPGKIFVGEKVDETVEDMPTEEKAEEFDKPPSDETRDEISVNEAVSEEQTQKQILTPESGLVEQSEAATVSKLEILQEDEESSKEENVTSLGESEQRSGEEIDHQTLSSSSKIPDRDDVSEPTLEGFPTKTEDSSNASDEQYEADHDTKGKDQMTEDTMTDMVQTDDVMQKGEQEEVESSPSPSFKEGINGESMSDEKERSKQVEIPDSYMQDSKEKDEILVEKAISESPTQVTEGTAQVITHESHPIISASSKVSSSGSVSSKKSSSHVRSSKKSSASTISPSKKSSSTQSGLKSPYSEVLSKRSKVGLSRSSASKLGGAKTSEPCLTSTKKSLSLGGQPKKASLHAKSSTLASKPVSEGTKSHSAHVASFIPKMSDAIQRSSASVHSRSSPTLEPTPVRITAETTCKSSPCVTRDEVPASSFIQITSHLGEKSSAPSSSKSRTSSKVRSKTTSSSPYLKTNKSCQTQTVKSRQAVTSSSLTLAASLSGRKSKGIIKSSSVKGVRKGGVSPTSHRSLSSSKSTKKSLISTKDSKEGLLLDASKGPSEKADDTLTAQPDELVSVEPGTSPAATPASQTSVKMSPVTSAHSSSKESVKVAVVSKHTPNVATEDVSPVALKDTSMASVHTSQVETTPATTGASDHTSKLDHASPVTSSHTSPMPSDHALPMALAHAPPVTSDHASPVAPAHTSPVGSDHASPVASVHASPMTSAHAPPVTSDHASPVASAHTSPLGSDHASPVGSDHTSLVASDHASPVASVNASPTTSAQRSPLASDHASPVASAHTSPVASDHASPVASDHTSPVASDHASPVASVNASPMTSAHRSPVASDHASSVEVAHSSPVAPDHASPVAVAHTSPVASDCASSVAVPHTSPRASNHASSVAVAHTSPVASNHASSVAVAHTSPVASDHTSPVASTHTSQTVSDHTFPPVASNHASSVAVAHTSPVASDHTSPVASTHTSQTVSDHTFQVAQDQEAQLQTDHSEGKTPAQPQSSKSHVQKKKSSLLSFFRRGSITRSQSETSDVVKIVQIARRTPSDGSRRSLMSRALSEGHGGIKEVQQINPAVGTNTDKKIGIQASSELKGVELSSNTDRPPSRIFPPPSKKSSKSSQRSCHSQASLSGIRSTSSRHSRRSSRTSVTSKRSRSSRTSRRSSGSSISKKASDQSKTSINSKGPRSRKSSRSSVYEVVEE